MADRTSSRSRRLSRRELLQGAGIVLGAGLAGTAAGCSETTTAASKWGDLAGRLTGQLLRPGDAGFNRTATPYNQRYDDIVPQAIAVCTGAADVRQCLLWARRHEVPFAVRSGGHSYAGYSATEGLLISVAPMRTISPDLARGLVTLGAGVQNRHLFETLPKLDVAVPNGRCPTVGLGGFVLGGGFGFNSRRLGLASDNLVRTTIVTADGETLTCDEHTNADLFWALRGGGGGNFGVNTSYVLRVNPIGPLSVYKIRWRWKDAPAVFAAAQSLMAGAPDALSARIGLDVSAPASPGAEPGLSMSALGQYFGSLAELELHLAPLLAAAEPTTKEIRAATYTEAVDFFAANVPVGRFTEKSSYIGPAGFGPELVSTAMTWLEQWPGSANVSAVGLTMFAMGGAMGRPSPTETAFVHRSASWLAVIGTSWAGSDDQEIVDRNLAWLSRFDTALAPYVSPESYQNFADPALVDWQTAYYGENLPRLKSVKRTYDPDNAFTFAQSIPLPA